MRAKYIIIEDHVFTNPVVFAEHMNHSDVARMLTRGQPEKVTGAGFVYIDENGHYSCYGESTSLKIKSNEAADSRILNRYFGTIGEDE